MASDPRQFGWILAAWAAVVAQLAPPAAFGSCDMPCCKTPCSRVADEFPVQPAGGCPLCAVVAKPVDPCPSETTEHPCRCQLDARQVQPACPTRSLSPTADHAGQTVGSAAVRPEPPQVLGVSREYLAASLAVPIRPPRILFGVWRD